MDTNVYEQHTASILIPGGIYLQVYVVLKPRIPIYSECRRNLITYSSSVGPLPSSIEKRELKHEQECKLTLQLDLLSSD